MIGVLSAPTSAATTAPPQEKTIRPRVRWFTRVRGATGILKWCGNQHVVVYVDPVDKDPGLWLLDISGRRPLLLKTGRDLYPVGCTFDGEWLAYFDDHQPHRWQKRHHTQVLHRLRVRTGQTEPFAIVNKFPTNLFAPTANRVFLGPRPESSVPMPSPRWDVIWTPKGGDYESSEDNYLSPFWFPDSSAVGWHMFGGWRTGRKHITLLRFDARRSMTRYRLGRNDLGVLGLTRPNEIHVVRSIANEVFDVHRCTMEPNHLRCIPTGLIFDMGNVELLPDGSLLHIDASERIFPDGQYVAIDTRTSNLWHLNFSDISPNRRLILVTERRLPRSMTWADRDVDRKIESAFGVVDWRTLR